MSPRTPSLFLCAIALAWSLPASPAHAADPDAMSSPLLRAVLARHARAAVPGAVVGAATAPRTNAADPFHAMPMAFGSAQGTVTRPAIVAGAPFRAPSPYGDPPAGKFPATLGIGGDLFGWSLSPLGDMFGDGISDVVIGAPGVIGPLGHTGAVDIFYEAPGASNPPTILYGEQVNSYYGYSVAGIGDVNGDGYPDLLVGAPFFSVGANANAGKAYLYLGGPFGVQPVPVWSFTTGNTGDEVGFSVAWAGDVNNDGYDDWMVGAPGGSTVYLFKGGPGGLSSTPAWTYTGAASSAAGYCVATAGDVNGDGYADILVGAPSFTGAFGNEGKVSLFFGHPVKPSIAADDSFLGGQTNEALGQSVAAAGDVNGDGYADFVMGGPGYTDSQPGQGEALVAYGGPQPAFFRAPDRLEINSANARFGAAVSTAGDVNGDGYADIIVGATGTSNGTNQGVAYVFVGSQSGTIGLWYDSIVSSTPATIAGQSVGTPGDLTGDGFSEYWTGVVGAPSGEADVHFGRAYSPGNTEIVAAQGYDPNAMQGETIAAADVNGDGYDDLVVGAFQHGTGDPSDGEVSIFFGGPKPFPSVGPPPFVGAAPDWTYEGQYGDFFGFSLASAGDVNGDGYQDLIAGSLLHSGAVANEGQAQVFYGSPSGPVGGAPWTVEGDQTAGLFGYSVSGGGDLNGDGYDDVVVGAPQADAGVTYQGLAKVYYGSKFGLSHTPAVTYKGRHGSDFLGTGVAIVGDINGDGFDDLMVGAENDSVTLRSEGVAYVYYGSATGVHAAPDDSLVGGVQDASFGFTIYRLGDINGDGYDDVGVAAPNLTDNFSHEGSLSVFLGSASGLVKPAATVIEGGAVNEDLGVTGISAGDVNGDGYSDVVVGDPNSAALASGGGRVVVYNGGPGGLVHGTGFQQAGPNSSENLGYATLAHADFDGDGFNDLVYTAPGADYLNASEGATFLRFGNCIWFDQRNTDRPLAAWRADDSAPVSPGLRSDATTAFRLHGRGRSAAGRAKLRLESEVKPLSTPFNFAGHAFSGWQATGAIVPNAGSASAFDQSLTGLGPGTRYRWRARWQSKNLFFPYTPWFGTEQRDPTERHIVTAGGAGPVAVDPLPEGGAVALAAAMPNPSTAEASLAFTLPRAGTARLALYDLRGALVRTLFDGPGRAGQNRVSWDGRDAGGRIAPAGAYFVRLTALGEEKIGKLVRL